MRRKKTVPEVNAGSMADIAFLLLIFFLVTAAIPKDYGISRKLPKICPPGEICDSRIKQHNILRISVNENHKIMLNEDVIAITELKDKVKAFIDNNGDGSCDYCNGDKLKSASDNPSKAIISLQNTKLTTYGTFIEVQDELTNAYYALRDAYSNNVLKKPSDKLSKDEIGILRKVYPLILSEAELN